MVFTKNLNFISSYGLSRYSHKMINHDTPSFNEAQQRIQMWIQDNNELVPLCLSYMGLTALPELPPTLQVLWCDYNILTSLPELPPTLRILSCDHNELTSLPSLPQTLQILYCNYNKLTSLPDFPPTLHRLHCDHNQFTSLPEIPPSMIFLQYDNNPFTIQPQQPQQPQIQSQQQTKLQLLKLPPKHVMNDILQLAVQKGDICPILHEPLQENGCILTTCFHIFSKEGFAEWSKKSSECPTCREKCSSMT